MTNVTVKNEKLPIKQYTLEELEPRNWYVVSEYAPNTALVGTIVGVCVEIYNADTALEYNHFVCTEGRVLDNPALRFRKVENISITFD